MSILVRSGGMLTTVQDAGRFGRQQYGVPVSGAMDLHSLRLANILVGNPPGEAGLEITLMGPVLEFLCDVVVAVTGAYLSPRLDGVALPMYRAVPVRAGEVLSFGAVVSGTRAYLAVAGGLDVEPYMGSKSTYLRGAFGGYQGRSLRKDDLLKLGNPQPTLPNIGLRAAEEQTFPNGQVVLRVVPGPQDDCFTGKGLATFYGSDYTVTAEADRMGARLEGEPIEHIGNGNIISDGVAFGSVQVPPNGQPILMLADRQTTGGYPKIATVISADLGLAAQANPGMKVRFARISVEEAQELYAERVKALRKLEERLNRPEPRGSARTYRITVDGAMRHAEVWEG